MSGTCVGAYPVNEVLLGGGAPRGGWQNYYKAT